MALTLYEHPFASYCWKALIALYEREVPFEPSLVIDQEDRAELARLWPPATMPVLRDDAAERTVPESTAVVEYVDRIGAATPLIPAEPDAALQARLWDRVLDGRVMTPMQKLVLDSLRPEGDRDRHGVEEALSTLDQSYELLDARLADRAWLAGGEFTLADCSAAPSLFYARVVRRWDEQRLANLTRYFETLMQRSSVARVVAEARPYRDVFPLPWPDYAQ